MRTQQNHKYEMLVSYNGRHACTGIYLGYSNTLSLVKKMHRQEPILDLCVDALSLVKKMHRQEPILDLSVGAQWKKCINLVV